MSIVAGMKPPQSVKPGKRHAALVQVKCLSPDGFHCTQAQKGEKQHEHSRHFAGEASRQMVSHSDLPAQSKMAEARYRRGSDGKHRWQTAPGL